MSRRKTLRIEWVGGDLDEATEENLDAIEDLDIGYVLRLGGLDVSDPTTVEVTTDV